MEKASARWEQELTDAYGWRNRFGPQHTGTQAGLELHFVESKLLRIQLKQNITNLEYKITHDSLGLGRGCAGEGSWAFVVCFMGRPLVHTHF